MNFIKQWFGQNEPEYTVANALREGCKLGFEHARAMPNCTLEEYLAGIDELQEQLKALPDDKLRKLAEG